MTQFQDLKDRNQECVDSILHQSLVLKARALQPQRSATGSSTELYARHLFLPVTGLSSIGMLQLNANSPKVVIRCLGKLLTGGVVRRP